jgi:hypothetical protein
LLLVAGCGDDGPELVVDIQETQCTIACEVTRVDVHLYKNKQSGGMCELTSTSFAPSGQRSISDLDLQAGSTVRLVLLGFCGDECYCAYNDEVVLDPKGPPVQIKLERVSSTECRPPLAISACP